MTITKQFDSPEAYLAFMQAIPRHSLMYHREGWAGEDDWQKVFNLMANGDTTLVSAAEKILDQIQHADLEAPGVSLIVPSVVGFMPNVPAAIIGHPESMFSRQVSDIVGYQTPLSIYVESSVSSAVNHKAIANKGVAILAFALYMKAIRPVEINIVTSANNSKNTVIYTKLASTPLDLARACFMLTSTTYARKIGLTACSYLAGRTNYIPDTAWAWGLNPKSNPNAYELKVRECLQMSNDDVFITGMHLHDKLAQTDPVAWVKYMIEKHTQTREGE